MANTSPAALRVLVGRELRALREAADVNREKLATHMDWDPSKLSRIEQGQATVKPKEIDAVLSFLGADEDTAERVANLCSAARTRGSYGKVPDWARQYLGLEADAAELLIYDTELVPGLFQTEHYARAVLSTSVVVPPADIERVLESRMRRRAVLERATPPRVALVLGEAALLRVVGSPAVHREQLEYLREAAEQPNITVQILPFRAGEHAGLSIGFTLLTLDLGDTDLTWVYLEDLTRADCLDGDQHVSAHKLVFDRLRTNALGERETLRMLDERITELM